MASDARRLGGVVDEMVLTRVSMKRSADPGQLATQLGGRIPHCVIEDSRSAIGFLLDKARPDDVILVAGSLYLLGEIRPMLEELAARHSIKEQNLTHPL